MPPLMPTNVPAPIAQLSALPLRQGRPRLQLSAANPPPQISDLLLQQDVLPLHPSAVRAATPPLSVPLQGQGGPTPPASAACAHAPLFSALLTQRVKPPLQPSAVNPPPLPQISALPLQRVVLPLKPLAACAPPPLVYVLLQGLGETSILPSTISAYVPLLSALLLWKGVPLRHPSSSDFSLDSSKS